VLVVDDDRALRESVSRALTLEGYEVTVAEDGVGAIDSVAAGALDLVVLDLGLPTLDGVSVCKVIRARGDDIPILVLTARSEVSDRVSGLDAGADDFMTKPFALDELFARVRALLRRASSASLSRADSPAHAAELSLADLHIDLSARRARRGQRIIELSKTEFDLLALLVRNQGIVLDRTTIYQRIWDYDFGPDSKNLTVYLGYLRAKTEAAGESRLLHTVRGVGYVARVE